MDFSIDKYSELLSVIRSNGFEFQTFSDFIRNPQDRSVVLRHDVDLLPQNSLRFAKIQNQLGIKGTYYFRAVPESWDEKVIAEIAQMEHEVGYHYENLTTCRGDLLKAKEDFKINLENLRKLTDVSTICMHGSPRSKYDSKDLWKEYNYRSFGIIGEPYLDVDYEKVFYLTDTGRRWDGWKDSVRDKVPQQEKWVKNGIFFRTTDDIISSAKNGILPDKILFTFHPQRWHSNKILWTKELMIQNIKNIVKRYFYVKKLKANSVIF